MNEESADPLSTPCPKCGAPMNPAATRCGSCWEKVATKAVRGPSNQVEPPTEASAAGPSEATRSDAATRIVSRYRDGYRVADAINGFGIIVKFGGAAVGALVALLFLAQGGMFAIGGVIFGALVAGLSWVIGVLVAAQGQIVRAALDTAVNGSPFLTSAERLDAMGLS